MDLSEHGFAARNTLRRIKPPDAVNLLRPIENRRLVVGRHTAVTKPLCFGEVLLAAPQRQLRALALGDVAADAAIAEEPAPGVEAGLAADLVEPLLAVPHTAEAAIEAPLVRGQHRAVRGPARLVGRAGRTLPVRPPHLDSA